MTQHCGSSTLLCSRPLQAVDPTAPLPSLPVRKDRKFGGLRRYPAVKSMYYSFREPDFGSQQLGQVAPIHRNSSSRGSNIPL